jgi:Na+/H+ antiporter NhaD/arsenite permease-like protein
MGLLGTVLGLVVLSVGLWRSQVAPRWVPALLGTFIVVEFAGSAVTEWSFEVAAVLYLIAFLALARVVSETPASDWESGVPASADPALEPA